MLKWTQQPYYIKICKFSFFLASLFPFSIKKLYWCFARPWLSNGTNFIGFPKVFQKLQRLVKCVQWMKNRTLIVFSLAAILYLYKRHLCLDVFVSRTSIALSFGFQRLTGLYFKKHLKKKLAFECLSKIRLLF